MNRQAQLTFLPYILIGLVVFFIFAIVSLSTSYMGDAIYDELKENPKIAAQNETVKRINQAQSLTTTAFDQLVFIILIAVILGFITLAIFTDFHPVVIGVMILFVVIMVIIAGLIANAYSEIAATNVLSEKAAEFTFTNVVIGLQLPIIILVTGIVGIIIVLAKRGGQTAPV